MTPTHHDSPTPNLLLHLQSVRLPFEIWISDCVVLTFSRGVANTATLPRSANDALAHFSYNASVDQAHPLPLPPPPPGKKNGLGEGGKRTEERGVQGSRSGFRVLKVFKCSGVCGLRFRFQGFRAQKW